MKLLITGGCGFIGKAVTRRAALQPDREVVNVDALTYAADPEGLAELEGRDNYAFVEADIRDAAAMAETFRVHRPDAVINLAAESHVDRSIDGAGDFVTTNVVGVFTLLERARAYLDSADDAVRARFRFVQVSTDEVFGALGETGAFTETSPFRPNSPYAATKASGDLLARAWGVTYGLPVIVTNGSNTYGPGQFPEKLIPVVVLAACEGRPIPVYGQGANVREWMYVDDHADGVLAALDRGRPGESYNIAGGAEAANIDLVRRICAVMDELRPDSPHRPHAQLISFVDDRPGHDFRYAMDAAKIRDELGWAPATDLDDGLRRTVRWYLDNEPWWAAIRARGFKDGRLGLARAGAS